MDHVANLSTCCAEDTDGLATSHWLGKSSNLSACDFTSTLPLRQVTFHASLRRRCRTGNHVHPTFRISRCCHTCRTVDIVGEESHLLEKLGVALLPHKRSPSKSTRLGCNKNMPSGFNVRLQRGEDKKETHLIVRHRLCLNLTLVLAVERALACDSAGNQRNT